MTLFPISASADLRGKGKRITSWEFSAQGGSPATVNLRDSGPAGTRFIQVQVAANGSASQAYMQQSAPLYPGGVYVEVAAGTVIGSVDLV